MAMERYLSRRPASRADTPQAGRTTGTSCPCCQNPFPTFPQPDSGGELESARGCARQKHGDKPPTLGAVLTLATNGCRPSGDLPSASTSQTADTRSSGLHT